MPWMAVYADQLRLADLRVTRPRLGILRAVQANPHADTETVFGLVRACLPEVSRQTAYDVLHALTEVGLLRRFQPAGSAARYETRVGDNHHHFVCRCCGAIADVDCSVGESRCLTPKDQCGFLLGETEVIYWGFCQTCSGGAMTAVSVSTAPGQTCRGEAGEHDLSSALPPRESRCRVVLPEEAGIGATSANFADAASERGRWLLVPAVMSSCAAVSGPTPRD